MRSICTPGLDVSEGASARVARHVTVHAREGAEDKADGENRNWPIKIRVYFRLNHRFPRE